MYVGSQGKLWPIVWFSREYPLCLVYLGLRVCAVRRVSMSFTWVFGFTEDYAVKMSCTQPPLLVCDLFDSPFALCQSFTFHKLKRYTLASCLLAFAYGFENLIKKNARGYLHNILITIVIHKNWALLACIICAKHIRNNNIYAVYSIYQYTGILYVYSGQLHDDIIIL